MKKIKQFSLKAVLLSLVAVLAIGLTSCSDETSGDQTQGKPGYLTLNLKTLKPKQTKTTISATDYQKLTDLNIFVFHDDALIVSKFVADTTNGGTNYLTDLGAVNSIDIRVGKLDPAHDSVVVVANYGSRLSAITSKAALKNLEVSTVGSFSNGLFMTGIAGITVGGDGFSYTSDAKVSPVMSKINVKFATSGDVALYYDITGIYIVNAVNKTKLPLIEANNHISYLIQPTSKTVSTGYLGAAGLDYDFYYSGTTADVINLADVNASGLTAGNIYSYYIGENYHADLPARNAGVSGGHLYTQAENENHNANTIILIKATSKSGAPAAFSGDRWYTYDLNNALISSVSSTPNAIDAVATTGYSTKRKTNYTVNFSLNSVGTSLPFVRTGLLTVSVQATGWDDATTNPTF